MRLLHVVPTYYPATRYGGPIQSVRGLCAALAARGHDVSVFTTNVDGQGDSAVPLDRAVDLDGTRVWYFPSKRLRRLYWSGPMHRALRAQAGTFDLIHLHSVFLWPTWAAARAARAADVPFVVSPRGMLVKELFHARSRLPKSIWMTIAEKNNLINAAGIHVTSAVEGRELLRFNLPLKGRVFEIPNGVVASAIALRPISSEAPYVLMLGRVSWKKRIDLALEALRSVGEVRLIVAGGDDEGLTKALQRQASALGVGRRVEFVGLVDGERKAALLTGALALLMPSVSENFGNSIVEALAVGTPAIVTPGVGAADLVAASGGGFVVEAKAQQIAAAIHRLLEEPGLRRQMGDRGTEAVALGYSWPRIAARMEVEYRTILARAPGGA